MSPLGRIAGQVFLNLATKMFLLSPLLLFVGVVVFYVVVAAFDVVVVVVL